MSNKIKEEIIKIYEKNHQKHKNCNTRSGECRCESLDLSEQILKLFEQTFKEILPEVDESVKKTAIDINKQMENFYIGFNECRQQIITNLKNKFDIEI